MRARDVLGLGAKSRLVVATTVNVTVDIANQGVSFGDSRAVNLLVVGSPAEVLGEAVESVQVLKPRVGCVTTESCDGVGDVGARTQHGMRECAEDALEAFGVEGKRLVEDELFHLSEVAYISRFVRSREAGFVGEDDVRVLRRPSPTVKGNRITRVIVSHRWADRALWTRGDGCGLRVSDNGNGSEHSGSGMG